MKIVFLAMLLTATSYGQWITGFYSDWAGEPVAAVPYGKYTHVIHFSAEPGANGAVNAASINTSLASTFVANAHAAGAKALYSITSNTSYFTPNTQPATIGTFVNNLVAFMNAYGYDGIDLDWEANINTAQYADLIRRLRSALGSGKLLTISAYGGGGSPKQAIVQAGPALFDQVNMMTYDMDIWAGYTWFNTCLLKGPDNQTSIQSAFEEFVSAGVPANKIGIGIGLYARHYTGANTIKQTGAQRVGSPKYRDLVNSGLLTTANMQYDTTYGGAYLSVKGSNEFYPYTSTREIQDIVSWGKSHGIGGFMTYTLDEEYLSSQSGDARYPLSSALRAAVGSDSAAPAPAPAPQPTPAPAPTPTPAPAPQPTPAPVPQVPTLPTGWVSLVSANSGLCLDVPTWSGSNWGLNYATQLAQWTCWGGDMQKFQLLPVAAGEYQILIKLNGLSLDIDGGPASTGDNVRLIQWPFWGGSNEIFTFEKNTDGTYTIHPKSSGKCLDVAWAATTPGASVIQFACNGGANQRWSIIPAR